MHAWVKSDGRMRGGETLLEEGENTSKGEELIYLFSPTSCNLILIRAYFTIFQARWFSCYMITSVLHSQRQRYPALCHLRASPSVHVPSEIPTKSKIQTLLPPTV